MDNWKKYMLENEDDLPVEDVDDKVWKKVSGAVMPKRRSFINKIKISIADLLKRNEGYSSQRRNRKISQQRTSLR